MTKSFFFAFCSACQNKTKSLTIFFKIQSEKELSRSTWIYKTSEKKTMASKTKIIILTSDEDTIQEISIKTSTATHIIDLNDHQKMTPTTESSQDLPDNLLVGVCFEMKNVS